MKRIVLLSKDEKASSQAEQWLRDLPEEVVLDKFDLFEALLAAFPKMQSAPHAPDENRAAGDPLAAAQGPPGEEAAQPKAAGDAVHVLIVDVDALGPDPLAKLRQARTALIESVGVDSKSPLAVLAMSYEGSESATSAAGRDPVKALRDEAVDDLILKPLDRSLFLQKIEILASGDPASAPSFLFKQKTALTVEIGKDASIDRIGESGFAIRSAAPLIDGLFARVYCSLFGEGAESAVYGRVYRNERHPEHPGEALAYFSFFGVTHAQLLRVRQFEKAQAGFRARGAGASHAPRPRPGKTVPGAPPVEHPLKHVIVIDVDPFAAGQVAETLESNFENVKTHRFPSYSSFLAHLKSMALPTAAADAPAPEPEPDLPAKPLFSDQKNRSFVVLASALDAVLIEPALKDDDEAFGVKGSSYAERPGAWLDAFSASEREGLLEFAAVIAGGRSASRAARVKMPGAAPAYLEIRGRREKAADGEGEARLRFDMKEIDQAAYVRLAPQKTKPGELTAVDAIFIDGGLIPADVPAWAEGLRVSLEHAHLSAVASIDPSAAPASGAVHRAPTIVLGDEAGADQPARFRWRELRDFIYRPLDRRLIAEKAAVAIAGLVARPDAPPVTFHACSAPAKIVKDALIEEFSEYGALIKNSSPLRSDSFMALFGPVFSENLGTPIWARCAYCAPGGEDGGYHCFFRFFGVGEDSLQRIRHWIREDYVLKKEEA